MAKTYLDQLIEYPSKAMLRIASDKFCAGLLANKAFDSIKEDDIDKILDEQIKDYQYVDETTQTTTAYVWVEADVPNVENDTIKDMCLYVTVACHKNYMPLNRQIFKGVAGNRRDNIVRYIDRVLNKIDVFGIGALKLSSVRTLKSVNGFTMRQLAYEVPDFNIVKINQ